MPGPTPTVPPLWPTHSAVRSATALDDAKMQFAKEEVRKRFSAISTTEMLAVLSALLTDERLNERAEPRSGRLGNKTVGRGMPAALEELKRNSASLLVGHSPATRLQHQASISSSVTASELSPRDWAAVNLDMVETPLLGAPASPRLSQEWMDTVAAILDSARQCRESADEHCSTVERVRAAIRETVEDTSSATPGSAGWSCGRDSPRGEAPAWLATLTQLRQVAEQTCHGKYEAVYERLSSEAQEEGEEGVTVPAFVVRDEDSAMAPSTVVARLSAHRATSGAVGIPPFSLVIHCGGAGGGDASGSMLSPTTSDLDSRNGAGVHETERGGACFVVGCEWFQWVFLAQCPLACDSEAYPEQADGVGDAEAVAAAQRKWRRRHCTVQLLYPSEAGFSDGSDGSSDLRSAEAEYELSEPHIVLTALLGVAMRVWCQRHPHLVAQVLQVDEDTYPQHIYDGSLFWSAWPLRDASARERCECAATSDSMPIPLLPGECFAHESEMDEGDDDDTP